jgi:ABC-2 type transport system ATP-binding protein
VSAGPSEAGAPGTGASPAVPALRLRGLSKRFGDTLAVDGLDLDVPAGSFFGLVGPNGAGKTTTLSMATGLLRPDAGTAAVLGTELWAPGRGAASPAAGKALLGVLPDGLRTFDRLTGAELVRYAGLLRGLDRDVALARTGELLAALDLTAAADVLVVDYSAGMTKKIGLACALVHAPRVLVLDEPFEAVDPVSATAIRAILQAFVTGGGTVVLSSHVMDLVQRLCDAVAVVAAGRVLAVGTVDEVRGGGSLEDRFVQLVGARPTDEGALSWLRASSR